MLPWKEGRPARAISLPRWSVALLDVVGLIVAKLLLAAGLLLLLLPLVLRMCAELQ